MSVGVRIAGQIRATSAGFSNWRNQGQGDGFSTLLWYPPVVHRIEVDLKDLRAADVDALLSQVPFLAPSLLCLIHHQKFGHKCGSRVSIVHAVGVHSD